MIFFDRHKKIYAISKDTSLPVKRVEKRLRWLDQLKIRNIFIEITNFEIAPEDQ